MSLCLSFTHRPSSFLGTLTKWRSDVLESFSHHAPSNAHVHTHRISSSILLPATLWRHPRKIAHRPPTGCDDTNIHLNLDRPNAYIPGGFLATAARRQPNQTTASHLMSPTFFRSVSRGGKKLLKIENHDLHQNRPPCYPNPPSPEQVHASVEPVSHVLLVPLLLWSL